MNNDPLILVKLNFFSFVATILKPYLERHQQNGLSVPYMYEDLKKLVNRLMNLVFKPSYMSKHSKEKSLLNVNIDDFKNEAVQKNEVECGCAASELLNTLKVTDQVSTTALKTFNKECKLFIFEILKKVKDRMLVGLPFLKRAAILNPSSVGELGKDRAVRRFTRLVH